MASIQFNKKGVLDRGAGSAKDLLDKTFDTITVQMEDPTGLVMDQFFETVDSVTDVYKMGKVMTAMPLPTINEDTDAIPVAEAAPGYDKSVTLYPYRQKVSITDTLLQTQRFALAQSMVGGLVKSPVWKKEYQKANIFNNAFSGTAGADSLPLCDNSHPHENNEQGTWDNLTTGALGYDSYQAARLLLRNMTNSQGYPEMVMPVCLLVPPALEQVAREIVGADRNPDNALNTKAVLNDVKVIVSNFLTSADAWFLIGDKTGDDKGLFEAEAIALNTKDAKPSDNPDIVWARRTKFMNATFFYRSKNIVGSAG